MAVGVEEEGVAGDGVAAGVEEEGGAAHTGEEELGRRRAGGGGHLGEGGAHIGENGGIGDIDIEIFKLKKMPNTKKCIGVLKCIYR